MYVNLFWAFLIFIPNILSNILPLNLHTESITEQNLKIMLDMFFNENDIITFINCKVQNIPLGTENLKYFVNINSSTLTTKIFMNNVICIDSREILEFFLKNVIKSLKVDGKFLILNYINTTPSKLVLVSNILLQ